MKLFSGRKIAIVALFILYFAGIFLYFLHPIGTEGDVFHHLSTGEYIWRHHVLPSVDAYTYTMKGHTWIPNAWGTDLLYYGTYILFGFQGLSVLVAFEAVLLFVLLYFLLRTYSSTKWWIFTLLSFAASIIVFRWLNRPEVITYPFVVGLLLCEELRKQHQKVSFFFPIIIAFWSVMYAAGVFVGLGLLSVFFFLQLCKDKWKTSSQQFPFYLSLLLSIPVTMLNGTGLKALLYIFLIPNITPTQAEWHGIFDNLQHLSISQLLSFQYMTLAFFIYLGLFLITFILFFKKLRSDILLILLSLSLVIPFFAMRNIPLAIVLTLPMLTMVASNHIPQKRSRILRIGILTCAAILIPLSFSVVQHGWGEDTRTFPPDLINYFQEHHLSGNVFANQNISSFLSFYLYPKVYVYTDTRDDLFSSTNLITDLNHTLLSQTNIEPLLKSYATDIIVGDTSGAFEPLLYDSRWALVYVDNEYLVFVKSEWAQEKSLSIYSAIDPYTATGAKRNMEQKALMEYHAILEKSPNSYNIQMLYTNVYRSLGQYNQMIEAAKHIMIPDHPLQFLQQGAKDLLLVTGYLGEQNCPLAGQYLQNLTDDVGNKFLFQWGRKTIPTIYYQEITYALMCSQDKSIAQNYVQEALSDSYLSDSQKENIQNFYQGYSRQN